MKKIFSILILTLFVGQSIEALDTKEPIMPRKPKNGTYTLAEAEKFILTDTGSVGKIAKWWRANALAIINEGLAAAGETLELKEENFHWMYQYGHITHEFKDLDPYINSRLSNGTPEWFNDADGWSGEVGVFKYGNCTVILYKSGCMNLLDIPAFITKKSPPPANRKDTTVVVNGQPITISITNTNSNTNTNTNTNDVPQTGGAQERGWVVDQPGPIYPTRGIYQTGPQFRLGVSLRFTSNGRGRGNCRPTPIRERPHASGPSRGHDVATDNNANQGPGRDINHASGPRGHN